MLNYIKQGALVIFLALVFGGALAAVQTQLGPMIKANQKKEMLTVIPQLMARSRSLPTDETKQTVINADTMEIHISGSREEKQLAKDNKTVEMVTVPVDFIETVRKIDVLNSPKMALFEVTVRETSAKAGDEEVVGYVIEAKGMGFADSITALVAVDPSCNWITGVYILDQKETPGLGDKIRGKWINQFAGMECKDQLQVVKGLTKPAKGEAVTAASQLGAIDAISGATISSQAVTDIVNQAVEDIRLSIEPVLAKLQVKRDAKIKKDLLLATPKVTSLQTLPSIARVTVDPDTMRVDVTIPGEDGQGRLLYSQRVCQVVAPNGTTLYEVKTVTPVMSKLLKSGHLKEDRLPVTAYMIQVDGTGLGRGGLLVAVEQKCEWVVGVALMETKTAPGFSPSGYVKWIKTFKGVSCQKPLVVLTPAMKIDAKTSATVLGIVGVPGKNDLLLNAVTATVNKAVADIRVALTAVKEKGGSNAK
jgi:electron transport complex protein RnfG